MACLDTTLLLDLRGRGGRKLQERAEKKVREVKSAQQHLTTTIFNVAELWVGIERAEYPEKEQTIVESIVSPLFVLGFDHASARAFGQITASLETEEQPVGDMDALIASVALVNHEAIITRHPRHFSRIPGLRVESY